MRVATFSSSWSPTWMATRIVDQLEAIEIEEEHGDELAGPLGLLDLGLKPIAEEDAVRQPVSTSCRAMWLR
jgi:hypothetical protein